MRCALLPRFCDQQNAQRPPSPPIRRHYILAADRASVCAGRSRPDALIVTDCGAVSNMIPGTANGNGYAKSAVDATAAAINAGVDLETGPVWTGGPVVHRGTVTSKGGGGLAAALAAGTVAMQTIDTALGRVARAWLKLGRFDPLAGQRYTRTAEYGLAALNATRSQELAADAAAQSFVLLKNTGRLLPLQPGKQSVAVVGPHATTRAGLLADYAGDSWCYTEKYGGWQSPRQSSPSPQKQ